MPSRCVVGACDGRPEAKTRSLTTIAVDENGQPNKQWVAFVRKLRPGWQPSLSSQLCSDHFRPDDFLNYTQFKMGFASQLRLKRGMIPSIQPSKENVEVYLKKPRKTSKSSSDPVQSTQKERKAASKLDNSRVDSSPVVDESDDGKSHVRLQDDLQDPTWSIWSPDSASEDKADEEDEKDLLKSRIAENANFPENG